MKQNLFGHDLRVAKKGVFILSQKNGSTNTIAKTYAYQKLKLEILKFLL
jgi:hypothetical protein